MDGYPILGRCVTASSGAVSLRVGMLAHIRRVGAVGMRHGVVAAACLCLVLACATTPVPQAPIPLNSERIAERFGSYGIEVLQSTPSLRTSDLYSGTGADRVTRTFAVVQYPAAVPPELADAHAEILRGGSIGAVLAARGWQVDKHNRAFDELRASSGLRRMMRLSEDEPLAMHMYVLRATQGAVAFDYALIAEVHHPEYLSIRDLRRIYGRVPVLVEAQRSRVSQMSADVAMAIAAIE